MMEAQKIWKLDDEVINRIAAGEVIQRPANALKELIENSLDAKSTNIQVCVKNGGLKLLQIQDNGSGIRKDDFEIVCERFTTSKLREFEDLSTISTYGFRGEALASISHVAHLTIQSKTEDAQCAYKASFIDGKLQGTVKPCAGNKGTQITVEDLFYNMTVRKRALKGSAEEYQKVSDVVGRYAVHNAHAGFCLKKSGENTDIRTQPGSTATDNIRIIYGNTIARELVDFEMENTAFRFKARGLMTNVNYTSKKFVFLLFINHRLVECQNLKKCLDQVYTTYLPKGMHPFIYMSLEIDSRSVDVNVHPTKHEVHFLNEDRIIELICTNLETKLLGSNNSRVFYTQARLPTGFHVESVELKDKEKKDGVVYPKDMVRTDYKEQKLEKFFGPTKKKSEEKIEENKEEIDPKEELVVELDTSEVAAANVSFENALVNKTTVAEPSPKKKTEAKKKREEEPKPSCSKTPDLCPALVEKITRVQTNLQSVLELRKEVEENCHKGLRDLFAQHVYVGAVDKTRCLVQHSTKLYLCNTQTIMRELFYELVVYNFENFGVIKLSEPLPLFDLAMIALDLAETGWTPEDGDKKDLATKVAELLTEKGEMLAQYFSMEIDENGQLLSLPILLDNHTPEMSGLPMYVVRLATEVDWQTEKACFQTFARETALFYSQFREEEVESNWRWTIEHVFYPAIKDYFLPPRCFTENNSVLEIADLPNLYKVFERC